MTELRQAFRSLRKCPGFCATAVLTLALGICASTTMFSVLKALVIRPFSYPESEQIVQLWSRDEGGQPLSQLDYFDIKDRSRSYQSLGGYSVRSFNIGGEQPQAVRGVACTDGVLPAYGVAPAQGRWFTDEEEKRGAEVVVLSDSLWKTSFGGDRDLVGRQVRIDGKNTTVVGIMPADFEFSSPWMRTESCMLWKPLHLERGKGNRDGHWLCTVARLKSRISVGEADAELKAIGAQLKAEHPDTNSQKPLNVRSLKAEIARGLGASYVWFLSGAVVLVLLVGCANVAGMLLSRNIQRQGEFGVRIALGASRLQVMKISLAESFLLALAGGLLGVLLSLLATDAVSSMIPATEARKAAIAVDWRVLVFASVIGLLSTLLSALPSLLASRRLATGVRLQGDSRSATQSRERHLTLKTLIVGQVALAFVLAYAAVLFSSGYAAILAANRSLASEYVVVARVSPRGDRYAKVEQRTQLWFSLAERLSSIPGVSAAGLTNKLPLEGGSNATILVNDEVFDPTADRTSSEISSVTSGYFPAVGLTLLKGRNLLPSDAKPSNFGILVNRTLAERCWPGRDPIGKAVRGNGAKPFFTAEVVGVVEDVRQWGANESVQPELYWPPDRSWSVDFFVVLRSDRPADQLVPTLRKTIAAFDPDLPIAGVRTLREVVNQSVQGHRSVMQLVDVFMGLSLLLVAVGVYGTLTYQVMRRVREIGVRMALGAESGQIQRLVVGQGTLLVLLGSTLGIAAALSLNQILRSLVYDRGPLELGSLSLALALVAVVALLAAWLPARRAARMDPVEALRAD